MAVHVIQRGNNRVACFREDVDYLVYLSHLRELSKKHGCAVHAYCLMTNHVHVLMTPKAAVACTNLMRDLGQRYVQYFNRRHGRSGTLWEGRYHSCLVESARYILACYRYIELNPVRAEMADQPGAYLWSSYAVNSGSRVDPFVTGHSEFLALATEHEERGRCYRELFEQEIDEGLLRTIRDATNGGYPLATDEFKATVIQRLGWKTAPGKPGPRGKTASGSKPDSHQTEFGL